MATVQGRVTDVAAEREFGNMVYVIEIDGDDEHEANVIIEICTVKY